MNHNEQMIIEPFTIERICDASPDIEQLTLKHVDNTESVYTRRLAQLKEACLPDSVMHDATEGAVIVSWDLFLVLKYRQDWTPTGYGLGELLYAISLLPNEELTMEVKTWETSKTQQDVEDSTEARNVSDIKKSNSTSNEVTTGEEIKTNLHVDAKASYSGFGFSASVEGGWAQDVNQMQQEVAKEAQESSQQATNDYRATHKVKLATSREEGSESKTTRKIKNINQAHTLNANFYEVIREYNVLLDLYAANLVLLGAEVDLAQAVKIQTREGVQYVKYSKPVDDGTDTQPPPGDKPLVPDFNAPDDSWFLKDWGSSQESPGSDEESLTIGRLLRYSHSPTWVQAFIDRFGISPVKVLWSLWSAPLYDAALAVKDISDDQIQILPEDREEFQRTMLQYVRPGDGWVEADEKGEFRWAYEVRPGQEKALLDYLYQFLPYGVQQLIQRATIAGMELATAYRAVLNRYVEATNVYMRPTGIHLAMWDVASRPAEAVAPLKVKRSNVILVPGPFIDTPLQTFDQTIDEWTDGIMDQLDEIQNILGPQREWTVTLPTQGVYADLALGVCSGAEDYYEIQRQFDLELKKMEVEKLCLEVEKLRLQNELLKEGKSPTELVIDNPSGTTALNLYLGLPESLTALTIKEGG